jgi:eukaryotic-like serine/threonine-protein kinase
VSVPELYGRYRVEAELGRGAMGVVYRGVDPALERPVAIKVIRAGEAVTAATIQELEARFLREAKVAARINHPGVVTVYDAGREGDSLYLVMELVDGKPLGSIMRQGQFPDPIRALDIVAQAADALGAAHALGVIHRDVKPANLMVTSDGRIKVSDFGVAKSLGEDTGLTRTGTVVGSPAYMSPEQIRGEKVDGRADLFSLGVILYELLLHRKPFPADTLTTLIFQILNDDPLAESAKHHSLPAALGPFLASALAKNPADRFPDAATFARNAREVARQMGGPELAGVTVRSGSMAAPIPQADLEATGPTRLLETPTLAGTRPGAAPAPPAIPLPAPPLKAGMPTWAPIALGGIGVVALVVVAVLLLRPHHAPVAPPPPVQAAAKAVVPPPPTAVPTVAPTPTPADLSVVQPIPTLGLGFQRQQAAAAVPTAVPRAPVLRHVQVPPPVQVRREAPQERAPVPTPTPPIIDTYMCRRGAIFDVSPEKALVGIQGHDIGIADDWDGKLGGRVYYFPRGGTFYVRLALSGYATRWIKVIVDPDARDDVVDVNLKLSR